MQVEWRRVPRSEPCGAPRDAREVSLGNRGFHLPGARVKHGEGPDRAQTRGKGTRPRTVQPGSPEAAKGQQGCSPGIPWASQWGKDRGGESVKTECSHGERGTHSF